MTTSGTTRGLDFGLFSFFRVREEPTTMHPEENSLNLEHDREEGLFNREQKQSPKEKY